MFLLSLALISIAAPQEVPDADALMAGYRTKARADARCREPGDDGEIIVCSRREADKYRVPLVTRNPRDSVPLRTATLVKDVSRLDCGQRAVIAQCGPGFGVSMAVGADGKTRMLERERAP